MAPGAPSPRPSPGGRGSRILAAVGLGLYLALLLAINSDVAGGSDSSGYLNAARLFSQGRVSEPVRALTSLSLPASDRDVFIPLGFRPGAEPGTMAPSYPTGLPLHMAAAAIGGWRLAPFLVVPLSAAAALALLFRLAWDLGLSRGLSAAGAVLLAACPIFFGMAIQPMSDVPAAAWVTATILLGLRARKSGSAAVLAGAALGTAVLVRPTNVLAAIPLTIALWPSKKSFLLAAAGALPLAGFLLAYDHAAFGSAVDTGYGAILSWTMSWSHFVPVIRNYGHWIPVLMTPLLPLAWLLLPLDRGAPWRHRLLLLAWFGVFLGFYLFYEPFEDWWSARFLLPGLPAMILAGLFFARDIGAGLSKRFSTRALATAGGLLLAAAVALDVRHVFRFDLLSMWRGETVYRDASLWAASAVPRKSLIVSMQMSGALKYYTDLPIARWDRITPQSFPRLSEAARRKGFVWRALLRGFEEPELSRLAPGTWTRIGHVQDVGLWRLD